MIRAVLAEDGSTIGRVDKGWEASTVTAGPIRRRTVVPGRVDWEERPTVTQSGIQITRLVSEATTISAFGNQFSSLELLVVLGMVIVVLVVVILGMACFIYQRTKLRIFDLESSPPPQEDQATDRSELALGTFRDNTQLPSQRVRPSPRRVEPRDPSPEAAEWARTVKSIRVVDDEVRFESTV